MMRTSIVFLVLSALIACSLAAPALDRRVRQASSADLLNTLKTGMSILSKHSKFSLAQSLNVSCSCLNSNSTGTCQTLRSALKATCRLYDANRILPNTSLPDQTAQEVLVIMSEKTIEDACTWMNETLHSADIGSSGLPSGVHCSNTATLGNICSQWDEFTSIMRIESKVDLLGSSPISESTWLKLHRVAGHAQRC